MKKKLSIFALAMLILGGGSSIALQSFAQAPSVPSQAVQTAPATDQNIDQKDASGNDIETNDDSSVAGEKESADGKDSDAASEAREQDGGVDSGTEQAD
jgi:hypothetical protein